MANIPDDEAEAALFNEQAADAIVIKVLADPTLPEE
jgi:hypothetical protein